MAEREEGIALGLETAGMDRGLLEGTERAGTRRGDFRGDLRGDGEACPEAVSGRRGPCPAADVATPPVAGELTVLRARGGVRESMRTRRGLRLLCFLRESRLEGMPLGCESPSY